MVRVVTHNAASVDGRIDGVDVDLGTFYGLAGQFEPDALLVGSDTLIEGMAGADDGGEAGSPEPAGAEPGGSVLSTPAGPDGESADDEPGDPSPLLVVPDSRGRIDDWAAVRAQPYWRDPVVLCSDATPASYLATLDEQGVEYLVAGDDHADSERAITALAERDGIETVFVDSGGTLSGHLFRSGLVDEVSLLVHPTVVGGGTPRSFVRGPDPSGPDDVVACSLSAAERVGDGLVWLRYAVDGS